MTAQSGQKLTRALARYNHVRVVGDLLFIAGQGCRDPETNGYAGLERDAAGQITRYDIVAQTRACLANIERVLTSVGRNRSAIVDATVFLCDMSDFEQMNAVWNDFFAECEPPTRTTVAVKKLPGDNFVEIKAIATRA